MYLFQEITTNSTFTENFGCFHKINYICKIGIDTIWRITLPQKSLSNWNKFKLLLALLSKTCNKLYLNDIFPYVHKKIPFNSCNCWQNHFLSPLEIREQTKQIICLY